MSHQLTAHFHLDEFRCPCCGKVREAEAMRLAVQLERARATSGPMAILSGYRCEKHNTQVNGEKNSAHMLGLAADLAVSADGARFRLIKALLDSGFKRLGIGSYLVHADISTLTPPVIWTYYNRALPPYTTP